MDIDDYKIMNAKIKLISELYKGEKSGEEMGWLSFDDVTENLTNLESNTNIKDEK